MRIRALRRLDALAQIAADFGRLRPIVAGLSIRGRDDRAGPDQIVVSRGAGALLQRILLRRARPRRAVLLGSLLSSGEQIGWPDTERGRQRRHGSDGRPALGALDPADVVAVHAALKAKTLLGHAEFVASVADGLAEADEERVAC